MSSTIYRVDPRLVHATLMNAWVPSISAQQLIIVDTEVATDERAKIILTMSAMDVPIIFIREEDAKTIREKADTVPRIVLFASLAAAERALGSGLLMNELLIGHLPEAPGRVAVLPAVHLGANDKAIIRRLERRGVSVFLQPLPRDEKTRIHDLEPEKAALRAPVAARMPTTPPMQTPVTLSFIGAKLRVINERGLHLRAAHALAHLAANLQENVQVAHGPDFVNAKSLLGLTTLGATCGTVLDVVVTGPDPAGAMDKIRALFKSGFEEGAKPGLRVEVDE